MIFIGLFLFHVKKIVKKKKKSVTAQFQAELLPFNFLSCQTEESLTCPVFICSANLQEAKLGCLWWCRIKTSGTLSKGRTGIHSLIQMCCDGEMVYGHPCASCSTPLPYSITKYTLTCSPILYINFKPLLLPSSKSVTNSLPPLIPWEYL